MNTDCKPDRKTKTCKIQYNKKPSYYVGIGASAGGLEALQLFFENMQPENGMAFIVVQHLSPDYKSLMVELLSKYTKMEVLRVEDGVTLEPDKVYLIPPRKNMVIKGGNLYLSEQPERHRLNLPIDLLFRSLAEDQEDHAIGIILSGTGSDGTRGIRTIKEEGGIVMVQDEESAKFDGMPRSAIATGLADFILPPAKMPGEILNFISHPCIAEKKDLLILLLKKKIIFLKFLISLTKKPMWIFHIINPLQWCAELRGAWALPRFTALKNIWDIFTGIQKK